MAQEVHLFAPEIFTSGSDSKFRDYSISFINEIESCFKQRKNVVIDLSYIKEAYAESTLLLFATIHSIRCRSKRKNAISIIYPEQNENHEGYGRIVLSGLKEALEAKTEHDILALNESKNYYQSGYKDSREKILMSTNNMIQSLDISPKQKIALLTAISEALLNIQHHAYTELPYLQRTLNKNRWWQCCWYVPSLNRIVFLIYDLGLGALNSYAPDIPDTLPQTRAEKMQELMSKGFSRFNRDGEGKRGKGSEDLKNVIQNFVEQELLTIYTDEVVYAYQYSNQKERTSCIALSPEFKIKGTLIVWSLTLSEKGN